MDKIDKIKETYRYAGRALSCSSWLSCFSPPLRFYVATVIILIAVAMSCAQLRSDRGWVWQNPLPQGNALYSIHFASDKLNGFAVGDDHAILRTTDGGFTWENETSPVDTTLSSVFVRSDRSTIIVGARGTILSTDDAGKKWRLVDAGSRDHLYGITFVGPAFTTGWAVGSYGHLLKTTDGGETWRQQLTGSDEHLLKVSALRERDIAVAAANGIVFVSGDGGDTWHSSKPCGGSAVSSVSYISGDRIVAAGFGGCIAVSGDSGSTWQRSRVLNSSDFLKVRDPGKDTINPNSLIFLANSTSSE